MTLVKFTLLYDDYGSQKTNVISDYLELIATRKANLITWIICVYVSLKKKKSFMYIV